MYRNSNDMTREMISMEEYLIKRQAIRENETKGKKSGASQAAEWSAAMELAEIMYV